MPPPHDMQVSFVIPVFNQVSHTRACLDALAAELSADVAHEIILVDDGSDEQTRAFLDSLPAPVRVKRLPENQGFAAATNHGANLAGGRWVCLLNNDVEITAGSIEAMLAVKETHPDAGIIGNVQTVTATGEVDHAGIRFIDGGYPVHDRPSLEQLATEPHAKRVPAVTAACCLVDREWFVGTGGLDCAYRNGFEDVDLCLRAREAGWEIYLSTRSIVRHAVSSSEGRGRFEYRNARRFLARWEPRAAALEIEAEQDAAKAFRLARARAATAESAPPAVRAAHQRVIEQARDEARRRETPATVWVDLLRMEPRGANGGIKPLVYGLLKEMQALRWQPLRFVVLAQGGLREELGFLQSPSVVATRDGESWNLGGASTACSSTELKNNHPPEVLYCPFGTSEFARPDLPSVCLLVDALHRDLPSALPIEEVNFREDNFKRVAGAATWIQTLAGHGSSRLAHHYGLHPTRCFHTYAAVHRQLDRNAAKPPRSRNLPEHPFFFYPANFWPHKNHEVLLTAYRLYRHEAGEDAWDLLLTGHPDQRMDSLKAMSHALGLADQVNFAGHLPDADFVAVWHHAGALVFPSLHEGFGIPLVEAFQAGLPVAAAKTSALPEVGGDACAWFDPRDPRDLAATMGKLARDPDWRARLQAAGTKRLSHFSLHREASRLNHFLFAAARNRVP